MIRSLAGLPECNSTFATPLVEIGGTCGQDYECMNSVCQKAPMAWEGVCAVGAAATRVVRRRPLRAEPDLRRQGHRRRDRQRLRRRAGKRRRLQHRFECKSRICAAAAGATAKTCNAPTGPVCFYGGGCSAAGGAPGIAALLIMAAFVAMALLPLAPHGTLAPLELRLTNRTPSSYAILVPRSRTIVDPTPAPRFAGRGGKLDNLPRVRSLVASRRCSSVAGCVPLGELVGAGPGIKPPSVVFVGASLVSTPSRQQLAAYYCPDLVSVPLGGATLLCQGLFGARPSPETMAFAFDARLKILNPNEVPLPMASVLAAVTVYPGAANAQTGATCLQLCPGGPGTCAGQDPATACQASSRDVRSLSDFANAAAGLMVSNGLAVAAGQPPSFTAPDDRRRQRDRGRRALLAGARADAARDAAARRAVGRRASAGAGAEPRHSLPAGGNDLVRRRLAGPHRHPLGPGRRDLEHLERRYSRRGVVDLHLVVDRDVGLRGVGAARPPEQIVAGVVPGALGGRLPVERAEPALLGRLKIMSLAARCSGPYSAIDELHVRELLASIVNVFCHADGWP